MVSVLDCGPTGPRFESASHRKVATLTFLPVVHDWVIKSLSMPSRVCATGHIEDPVPFVK